MVVKVRFAPSPTGRLHVGNLRTALLNKLLALHMSGVFMLRIDDTDKERSTKDNEEAIKRDLQWLGLSWQETANQSERLDRYEEVFNMLKDQGLIYACYETAEELEYKRRRLLSRHKAPVYDREGLNLSQEQIAEYEKEGRKPHFRFKLPDEPMEFDDIVRGQQHFEAGHISDPVIRRADGSFLYMLPSVIDDVDFGITHVIRGEDHTSNTALQLPMFQALGADIPNFAHVPLMVGEDGEGLSKRLGSLGIEQLRSEGIEAGALNGYLASLGSSQPEYDPALSLEEIGAQFDLGHYARNTPRFDFQRLWAVNHHLVQSYDFSTIAERLKHLEHADAAFWLAIRDNCEKLADADFWHEVVFGTVAGKLSPEDQEFTAVAAELLPDAPYDHDSWKAFTDKVKDQTGRKGKSLFMPLRLALTGLSHGPELKYLLPLIGKERAYERLKNT